MDLYVLALDGVFDTGLAVVVDTFTTANELAVAQGGAAPFRVRIVGMRRRVQTANGFSAAVTRDCRPRPRDWVVVPALNAKQPAPLLQALARSDVREAVAQLRAWHAQGVGLAAACGGTFLLAEAGVLDARQATTTWSLAPFFRQRYPQVALDDSRMVVPAGRVVTAGAAMGHLDLSLWLLRQMSPALAAMVARFLLIDQRSSQAKYMIPDHLAHADPLVERFERWARANLARGFSLQEASRALAVGPRTLQRRTDAVLGKSPLAFVQDLRIQCAQHLLAIGQDLESIAAQVGYADGATLRSLLRRKLGLGVRELRAEHAGAAPGA